MEREESCGETDDVAATAVTWYEMGRIEIVLMSRTVRSSRTHTTSKANKGGTFTFSPVREK